jgi:integrase/recombinase XerD
VQGTTFADRRDKAMIYMLASTGMRAGELMALTVADVDVPGRTITIRHGKGDKERKVPLAAKTAEAVASYLRARRAHKLAQTEALWLGQAATGLGYQGAVKALSNRAQAAGVEGFHLHRFRHSFASRFKRKGGSDDELMSLAGWTDPAMARLYAADTASERARATALLMNLDTFD